MREGYVIRNLPGHAKCDESQLKFPSYRICRRAQLPERGWHTLRHLRNHAALFGVNPWRLMTWLGHKRIEARNKEAHEDLVGFQILIGGVDGT